MTKIHNKQILKPRRVKLRENQTNEESILWEILRRKNFNFKFKRQHSIGPYIVDFYCATKRIAIELDGNQHKDALEYDQERSNFLESKNIKVLRFWNNEIQNNIENVLNKIKSELSI